MPKPYVALPFVQGTPEWVDARKRLGITASEAAAACGFGRYGGPFDVYGWHVGLRADLIPSEEMLWGTLLEPVVAEEGARQAGIRVRKVRRLLQSTLYPWLLCSLDRWGSDGNLVEIKTSGIFAKDWGEKDSAEVPVDPIYQVQTQMAVTGAPGAHVWALFGGQHLKRFFIPRDQEFIELIAAETHNLWFDHIVPRIPPPIDGSESASVYLAQKNPTANGATIDATPEMRDLAFTYLGINAQLADLEAKKALARNQLVEFLGENSVMAGGDVKVTLFNQAGSEYTVVKKPTRVLRVSPLEA